MGVEEIEQIVAGVVDQAFAPHCHRNALGAGQLQRLLHQRVAGVLARSDDEAVAEGMATQPKGIIRERGVGSFHGVRGGGKRFAKMLRQGGSVRKRVHAYGVVTM